VLAAAALAAGLAGGCAPDDFDEPVRFSLLAVGDTGASPRNDEDYPRLLRVAGAMAAEDRRRAAQALLLLGDNFYDRGLRADELEVRVRANLVAPFCRFVALEGTRSHEVTDVCPEPPSRRAPVPIFAVLGNHDHLSAESPALQRETVPRFVSNWRMAPGPVGRFELADGVSLIAFDSEWLIAGANPAPLREALHNAPGDAIRRRQRGRAARARLHPARARGDRRRWRARAALPGGPRAQPAGAARRSAGARSARDRRQRLRHEVAEGRTRTAAVRTHRARLRPHRPGRRERRQPAGGLALPDPAGTAGPRAGLALAGRPLRGRPRRQLARFEEPRRVHAELARARHREIRGTRPSTASAAPVAMRPAR
jgi:hypothetical protein